MDAGLFLLGSIGSAQPLVSFGSLNKVDVGTAGRRVLQGQLEKKNPPPHGVVVVKIK